ncbi:hypothetical protein C1S80_21580 [Mycolicibacterium aubagnense]|nr:hypothetical protein C1S80_21580 [Mycolicibacterium aubagnense]
MSAQATIYATAWVDHSCCWPIHGSCRSSPDQLNLVQRWFAELTTKKLCGGTHTSVLLQTS